MKCRRHLLMSIDFLSGLAVTRIFKKSTKKRALESKAGFKGLCHKYLTLLFVLLAYRLDLQASSGLVSNAKMMYIKAISHS